MDLNLLTTFEAVARTASFSGAARELRQPKSSVSRAVARLEAELGVQLLFRTTRRVSLRCHPRACLHSDLSRACPEDPATNERRSQRANGWSGQARP